MRADLTFEMPPGRIASSISASGASRTACQRGKRVRRRRKATSRLRSLVDCESTVSTSSAIGWPCGAHQRDAVDLAQAVAHAQHARARRRPPGGAARRGAGERRARASRRRYRRAAGVYPRAVPEVSERQRRDRRAAGLLAHAACDGAGGARRRRAGGRCRCTCTACRRTATTGCRSSRAAAASRRTCPASGARASRGRCSYTIDEYADFLERFLDARARSSACSMVVHDWGAVGLAFAQRHPERDRAARRDQRGAVAARLSLAPHGAHLAHAGARRAVDGRDEPAAAAARLRARPTRRRGRCRRRGCDTVLDHFDQGTQRAILRLYRSSPPEVLAAAGDAPRRARRAGARGVGRAGPLHPGALRAAYADALGGAELLELADAGHWPWLDRPGRDRARRRVPRRAS